MPIDFTVHKRLLTREEKRKIANAHKKTGCAIPEGMDYVSFMKNDIYDEFVIFKCTKCKFEDPVPDWLLNEFGGFSLLNKKIL